MPKITFNSFYEGASSREDAYNDLQAIYEGVEFGIKAFEKMTPLDGNITRVWPPEEVSSEEDLKQWIQDEAWGHHASCSCQIGADDDPMAVLDGQFRVRGVDGLRVVDASVFPKLPGTFPALPLYMVSEKAADDNLHDIK
ncbi:choline dehydrogenase [Pseudomassariella vexata]|uniref:Choline dehydrogenase n=1 Tax=Pseudomassariella vexata TaxID=1141098 RepID=A0A1Y2EBL3_9PEZI|nr:choline dehydrogenase [Pseudomassariella vexata]ORY68950.1 choline dehydrogenase [Pseudomassariella vexata]